MMEIEAARISVRICGETTKAQSGHTVRDKEGAATNLLRTDQPDRSGKIRIMVESVVSQRNQS